MNRPEPEVRPDTILGVARNRVPMRFAWEVEDVIDPREYAGRRATAVRAITVRYTEAMERLIRRYPEQYFWLHRRWKHQPPARNERPLEPTQPAAPPAQLVT